MKSVIRKRLAIKDKKLKQLLIKGGDEKDKENFFELLKRSVKLKKPGKA